MKQKLLVVEDEAEIRESVRELLQQEGYDVLCAENGSDALIQFSSEIDLIIMDVMMPGMSGYEVCRDIRKKSDVPILFLTAKSEEEDLVQGFGAGGDDYLTKPFSIRELIMRIGAILRRTQKIPEEANPVYIRKRGIELDLSNHRAKQDGKEVRLTDTEFQMLAYFMQQAGKVLTVRMLYEKVWQEKFYRGAANTVMVHIRKLRQKLEVDPQDPTLIVTAWGKGYYFKGE